jgi:hypothetical protein
MVHAQLPEVSQWQHTLSIQFINKSAAGKRADAAGGAFLAIIVKVLFDYVLRPILSSLGPIAACVATCQSDARTAGIYVSESQPFPHCIDSFCIFFKLLHWLFAFRANHLFFRDRFLYDFQ